MTDTSGHRGDEGAGWRRSWAASVLSGPAAASIESARAELSRVRFELRLGHDDDARAALEHIVQRMASPPMNTTSDDPVARRLVLGSALTALALVRGRAGEGDASRDLYAQAVFALDSARSAGAELSPTESLEHALAVAAVGRVDEAIELATALDSTDPDAADLYVGLGELLAAADRPAAAVTMLERAASINADAHVLTLLAHALVSVDRPEAAVENFMAAGTHLGVTGQYDMAVLSFNAVLELDPDHVEALVYRAEALRLARRPDEALEAVDQALEQAGEDPRALVTRAGVLLDLGRLDELMSTAHEAELAGGDGAYLASLRAVALGELGRGEEAVQAAQTAVDLDPDDVVPHVILAQMLSAHGRNEEALQAIEGAINLEPPTSQILQLRADILGRLQRYDEALEVIDRAVALDPTSATALAERGEYLRRLERYVEAEESLRNSLKIAPDNAWAIGTLGETLVSVERLDDGLAELRRAAELDPSLTWVWRTLGMVLSLVGPYEEALAALDRAEPDGPTPALLPYRAGALLRLERYAEAIPVYEEAIDVAETPELQAQLGECLRRLERWADARERLERAIELDPDSAYAHGTLGQVLIELDEVDDGVASLHRALGLPESEPWIAASLVQALVQAKRSSEALDVLADADVELGTRDDIVVLIDYVFDEASPEEGSALLERLERRPGWPPGQLVRSQRLLQLGDLPEAIESVNRVVAEEDDWVAALRTKAILLELTKAEDDLALVTSRLLALAPDDPESVGLEARRLGRAGSGEEAEALLRALVARHEGPEGFEQLAEFLRYEGRLDDALDALTAAEEEGDGPTLYGLGTRGQVLAALGRTDEAVEALQHAIELDSENTWVTMELLLTLQGARRDLEALALAEQATSVPGASPMLDGVVADILLDLGDFEAARARCTASIDAGWAHASIFGLRGWTELLLGDNRSAIQDFQAAIDQGEDELHYRRGIADAELRLESPDKVRKLFQDVLDDARADDNAQTVDGLALVGWCLYRLDRYDEATASLTEALAIDSLAVSVQFDLALVTLCAGEPRAAESEYERGIEVAERNEGLRARSKLRIAFAELHEAVDLVPQLDPAVADGIKQNLGQALREADRRYDEAVHQSALLSTDRMFPAGSLNHAMSGPWPRAMPFSSWSKPSYLSN